MKFIKGPDFPTGGMICGVEGIKDYFSPKTGNGQPCIKLRGRVGVEEMKGKREQIVITEIPFNVNRAALDEHIAELVNEKVASRTSPRCATSRTKTPALVIELKRDAIAKVVINNLYKHTRWKSSFSVNSLAIDHGQPKTLNLKELIQCYIEHRREVILRRTRFELRKAEERAECSKAISSRCRTSTNSSASSAPARTATRRASSCWRSNGRARRSRTGAF